MEAISVYDNSVRRVREPGHTEISDTDIFDTSKTVSISRDGCHSVSHVFPVVISCFLFSLNNFRGWSLSRNSTSPYFMSFPKLAYLIINVDTYHRVLCNACRYWMAAMLLEIIVYDIWKMCSVRDLSVSGPQEIMLSTFCEAPTDYMYNHWLDNWWINWWADGSIVHSWLFDYIHMWRRVHQPVQNTNKHFCPHWHWHMALWKFTLPTVHKVHTAHCLQVSPFHAT